jgi:hypothetical protein
VPLQRRTGPLERAVHSCDARVEQCRALRRRPAEHVSRDQHGPLFRREQLDRRDEGELDRLLGDDLGLRLIVVRGDTFEQPVGIGLEPRNLRERPPVLRGRNPRPARERVQAGVRRDAVEPGAERGVAPEGLPLPPGAEKGLLDGVLRIFQRAEHPVAVHLQLAAVAVDERRERCLIAGPRSREDACFSHLAHLRI